jgi:hypothetical protein
MFEGLRVRSDAGHVHSPFVGKGIGTDVGLICVERKVDQICDLMGDR